MALDIEKVKLGKGDYAYDARTLALGAAIKSDVEPPHSFDHDSGKAKFPLDLWGNDQYGDCVFVSEANGLVRLERSETRHTPKVTTDVVLGKYKTLTGCQKPGDEHDSGYVILEGMKDWRNAGWQVGKATYKIDAYGELNKLDRRQLRQAIWLLDGIFFGLQLPITAQAQIAAKVWDNVPTDDPQSQPGSWGGHAVFAKRYDENGIYVLTWGQEVYCTNAFIERYADEAWAVVDALDSPANTRYLDVAAMEQHLHDIGASKIDS